MLVGYLGLTTVLGARLAGKQTTLRDFFLGGRKLPWPAVAGSIIATEISAVTFVGVPAVVFAAGGNLTYLQLALGAILARVIIGLWFVPAFYEREVYSPYDYMGRRLGLPVRSVTSGLFMLGAVLGQSVRVLLTAVILQEISGLPLTWSIWIIGVVAIAWTLLGGITTVIWTDVIQFLVFTLAMAAALVFVVVQLPGGWGQVLHAGAAADKLRVWDLSADPNRAFTLWAALLGNTLLCLNAYGTDQLIAQRMFCCRGPRAASTAIIASSLGLATTALALLVGLGLYAFYQQHPLAAGDAARLAERVDRVFPFFIASQMPAGLSGLVIAGVFAAAISSLDSALAALSQTVVTGFYRPWREGGGWTTKAPRPGEPAAATDGRAEMGQAGAGEAAGGAAGAVQDGGRGQARRGQPNRVQKDRDGSAAATRPPAEDRHYLLASKALVVVWAVVLCLMAQVADLARTRYGDILNLALAMATYTGGALLAAFCLAFFRLNVDYRGLLWSTPLSVLTVFAISWHQEWAQIVTILLAAVLFIGWLEYAFGQPAAGGGARWRKLAGTAAVLAAGALAVTLCLYQPQPGRFLTIAWPWNVPLGFAVAFGLGYALARPRSGGGEREAA